MGAGNGGAAFRYPYNIETVLEPWREELGENYDVVVALLADRDRALEDYATNGDHDHDGTGDDSTVVRPSDDTNADAQGADSVAVGHDSLASGDGSVAVGNQAAATDTDTVAIGNRASANIDTDVAVGPLATASGGASVAIGNAANTSATNTTAVGQTATADEIDATAVGSRASSVAIAALALGADAAANAQGSIALGSNSQGSHQNATAIGYAVGTSDTDQVNIGQYRLLQGTPATAPNDAAISTSQLTFYLDEGSDILKGRAKYSDSTTLKTFQVGTAAPVTDHDDLTGVSADDHHAQAHVIDGADHTASGLTTRHVLRATGATSFAFGAIEDADLPSTITRDTELAAHEADTTSVHGIADTAALALTADVVTKALADAKGDLLAATAADTWVRLPVGTDDQVLTAASGETAGVKWADASGGGGSADFVPYYLGTGETFTLPEFKQALYSEPIELDGGTLDVAGLLIEIEQPQDLSGLFHMQASL